MSEKNIIKINDFSGFCPRCGIWRKGRSAWDCVGCFPWLKEEEHEEKS